MKLGKIKIDNINNKPVLIIPATPKIEAYIKDHHSEKFMLNISNALNQMVITPENTYKKIHKQVSDNPIGATQSLNKLYNILNQMNNK